MFGSLNWKASATVLSLSLMRTTHPRLAVLTVALSGQQTPAFGDVNEAFSISANEGAMYRLCQADAVERRGSRTERAGI